MSIEDQNQQEGRAKKWLKELGISFGIIKIAQELPKESDFEKITRLIGIAEDRDYAKFNEWAHSDAENFCGEVLDLIARIDEKINLIGNYGPSEGTRFTANGLNTAYVGFSSKDLPRLKSQLQAIKFNNFWTDNSYFMKQTLYFLKDHPEVLVKK